MAAVRQVRYSFFCGVLYPDEDASHALILKYIEEVKFLYPWFLKITHDKDIWLDDGEGHKKGDLKKSHVHVVFKTNGAITLNTLLKRFKLNSAVFQPCQEYKAYCIYLLHQDYESRINGKHVYSVDDLVGDEKLIRQISQNDNSVQFELSQIVHQQQNLYDIQMYIFNNYNENMQRELNSLLMKSPFYIAMSNQERHRNRYDNYDFCNKMESLRNNG